LLFTLNSDSETGRDLRTWQGVKIAAGGERVETDETGESAGLVRLIAAGGSVEGLRRFPGPAPLVESLIERPITVDQTHRSVVVGEAAVVKWMRPPLPAPQRTPALLAHLAEVGFARTAQPYAALYRPAAMEAHGVLPAPLAEAVPPELVALVVAFLPGAVDGWEWAVDDLLAELGGGPPAAIGTPLGELAAELHVALATPSSVLPVPVGAATAADVAGWAGQGLAALDEALTLTDGADGEWLAGRAAAIRADLALPPAAVGTAIQRLHGDLHVGQVLRWDGGYAVIDFDGNPTAPQDAAEPAARDVAQLLTSLGNVGAIANKRTGHAHRERVAAWADRERAALLGAYRPVAGELFDATLTAGFEAAQLCRELIYAARFLPRWRYAPMDVLRHRYPNLEP
jgi:maltokinase